MLDTAEPAIAASATEPAVSRPVGHRPFDALAAHIASPGTSTGERAALARLSPGQPLRPHEIAALARALIAADLDPEQWQSAAWQRWALIAHGIALAGHDAAGRLGAQLARAKVSEPRVTRLLTARGSAFAQLLPRLLRLLASQGVRPNWRELGPLILKESSNDSTDQAEAEDIRLRIAGAYFSELSKMEKGD